MRVLKAHVRGGRLLVDEPIDLPDGSELRVALIEEGETLPASITEKAEPRRPGSARGRIKMAPGFDAPLADFDEYMK